MIILKKEKLFFVVTTLLFLWAPSHAMKSFDYTELWQEFVIDPYVKTLKNKLFNIRFSPDEKYFCGTENTPEVYTTNSTKKFIHLWEINKTEPEYSFDVVGSFLKYFFSPNGKFLVIQTQEQTLIYSTATKSIIQAFDGEGIITFFPETDIFSISRTKPFPSFKIFSIKLKECTEIKAFTDVRYITFSNPTSCNQCFAAVLYNNNNLEIFEVTSGCQFGKKTISFNNVYSVSFIPYSPIANIIFNTTSTKKEYWNIATKKKIAWNNNIIFSPDKNFYVKITKTSHNDEQQLEIYNKQNKKILKTFKRVITYDFSESGNFVGICTHTKKRKNDRIILQKLYIVDMINKKTSHKTYILNNFNFSFDTGASAEQEETCYFSFLNCDNFIQFYDVDRNKKILRYPSNTPGDSKTLFSSKNSNIKNFFSGKTPPKINLSDLNILFQ